MGKFEDREREKNDREHRAGFASVDDALEYVRKRKHLGSINYFSKEPLRSYMVHFDFNDDRTGWMRTSTLNSLIANYGLPGEHADGYSEVEVLDSDMHYAEITSIEGKKIPLAHRRVSTRGLNSVHLKSLLKNICFAMYQKPTELEFFITTESGFIAGLMFKRGSHFTYINTLVRGSPRVHLDMYMKAKPIFYHPNRGIGSWHPGGYLNYKDYYMAYVKKYGGNDRFINEDYMFYNNVRDYSMFTHNPILNNTLIHRMPLYEGAGVMNAPMGDLPDFVETREDEIKRMNASYVPENQRLFRSDADNRFSPMVVVDHVSPSPGRRRLMEELRLPDNAYVDQLIPYKKPPSPPLMIGGGPAYSNSNPNERMFKPIGVKLPKLPTGGTNPWYGPPPTKYVKREYIEKKDIDNNNSMTPGEMVRYRNNPYENLDIKIDIPESKYQYEHSDSDGSPNFSLTDRRINRLIKEDMIRKAELDRLNRVNTHGRGYELARIDELVDELEREPIVHFERPQYSADNTQNVLAHHFGPPSVNIPRRYTPVYLSTTQSGKRRAIIPNIFNRALDVNAGTKHARVDDEDEDEDVPTQKGSIKSQRINSQSLGSRRDTNRRGSDADDSDLDDDWSFHGSALDDL